MQFALQHSRSWEEQVTNTCQSNCTEIIDEIAISPNVSVKKKTWSQTVFERKPSESFWVVTAKTKFLPAWSSDTLAFKENFLAQKRNLQKNGKNKREKKSA